MTPWPASAGETCTKVAVTYMERNIQKRDALSIFRCWGVGGWLWSERHSQSYPSAPSGSCPTLLPGPLCCMENGFCGVQAPSGPSHQERSPGDTHLGFHRWWGCKILTTAPPSLEWDTRPPAWLRPVWHQMSHASCDICLGLAVRRQGKEPGHMPSQALPWAQRGGGSHLKSELVLDVASGAMGWIWCVGATCHELNPPQHIPCSMV